MQAMTKNITRSFLMQTFDKRMILSVKNTPRDKEKKKPKRWQFFSAATAGVNISISWVSLRRRSVLYKS